MKLPIIILLIFPILMNGQNPVSKYFNSKSILAQANKWNHPEGADRDFTQNPDSVSIENYTPGLYKYINRRFFYNEDNLLNRIIWIITDTDSIKEKYNLDLSYNAAKELILVRITDIKNGSENYIGRYEYTNQKGRIVCEKAIFVQDGLFKGDSLEIEYDGDKIKSYKRLTSGLSIDKWADNEIFDSIVYVNDKVVGYDMTYYQNGFDTIYATHYRYKNTLFYNDDDDIFRQVVPELMFDTAYYVNSFPRTNAAEGILWELNYDRYRFSPAAGDFVLNEIRHADIQEDSTFIQFENFETPFNADITAAFNNQGKMISHYVGSNEGSQLIKYEYAPSGRISKLEVNNFKDFHSIFIYEYEFDSNDNITIFRELFDDDFDGISTLYNETRFFYFTGLMQNKSLTSTLNIYPNPTGNYFKLPLQPNTSDFNLKVYDSNGTLMKNYDQSMDSYATEDLRPGIYIIKSIVDNKIYYSKLVKL